MLAFKCFASSSASGEDEQVEKNQKNKTQQQDFKWKRMTGGIPDAMKVSGEDSVSLMTGRVKTKTTLCEERRREEREEKEMGGRENRLPLLFLFRFFFLSFIFRAVFLTFTPFFFPSNFCGISYIALCVACRYLRKIKAVLGYLLSTGQRL